MKEAIRIAAIPLVSLLAGTLFLLPHIVGTKPLSAPINSCIANLKQIEGAKNTWALEYQKMTNDVPTEADLFGTSTNHYIQIKPICAAGGVYTLGAVSGPPKCSIPEHNVW